jgi:hypothetical protein
LQVRRKSVSTNNWFGQKRGIVLQNGVMLQSPMRAMLRQAFRRP